MNKKRFLILLTAVFLLLAIPFIAMQCTNAVNWKLGDFVLMGILLLGTGLVVEFVLRKVGNTRNRILILGVIAMILLVIWAELAVGIFGSPFAGS